MNSKENATQSADIETKLTKILHQLGVPEHIKGYGYLRTAILLTINDPDFINSIGKVLYPTVAKQYQTTTSRVESAIHKAIEIAWDRGDLDTLNCHFGYTIQPNRGRSTPSEFIAQIADHILLETENDPMKIKVFDILRRLGVPAYIKGHGYLRTAILLTVQDPDIINSVSKVLYPSVAKQYQTTTSRVESAIHKAIEIAWDRGDLDTLNCHFGYTIQPNRGRSTSSEFIAQIADHILLETENDPMKIKVSDILRRLGVPAYIKGHGYLRTAILLTVQDPDIINSVSKVLYPSVAKEYQTTASRVESAIRKAIEIAWDRGDVDTLNCHFGYTIQNNRGKPTNSEFIAIIADNMRLRYRLF